MASDYRVLLPIEKCARCGYDKSTGRLHVHHIDYDHNNDDPNNLIVLCFECHTALHRQEWKLEEINIGDRSIKKEMSWRYKLSNSQQVAVIQIVKLREWVIGVLKLPEDKCWFTQRSLHRVTWHTLQALRIKEYLEERDYEGEKGVIEYYRWTGKELE